MAGPLDWRRTLVFAFYIVKVQNVEYDLYW